MKITDNMRLNFFADVQVGVGNSIYAEQFRLSQSGIGKRRALNMAIDAAIRAELWRNKKP